MSSTWSVCAMCHGLLCLWSRVEWRGWKLETERKWTRVNWAWATFFAFPDTCQSEIYCFHNHLSTKNNTILNINYQISNKDCSHQPRCRLGVPPVKCKYTIRSLYVCVRKSVFLLLFVSFFAGIFISMIWPAPNTVHIYLVHCLIIISIIAKSQWAEWNASARREKNC